MVYDLFHGQWKLDRDGVAPHRPFGAGLGYTTWSVDRASARVVAGRPRPGTTGRVAVDVANTGDRSGLDGACSASPGCPGRRSTGPHRRLVAFARVTARPRRAGVVSTLPYDLADLAVRRDGAWYQEPGRYELSRRHRRRSRPSPPSTVDLPGPG